VHSSPSPIPTASPGAVAPAALSCWPMVAGPISIPRQRWRTRRFLAVAEIAGSAAQGRIVLAAAITLAEIEALFADRILARAEIRIRCRERDLRAAACAGSALSRSRRSRAGRAQRRDGAPAGRRSRAAWHQPAAVEQGAAAMAGPGCCSCAVLRGRVAGPLRRCACRRADWLAAALAGNCARRADRRGAEPRHPQRAFPGTAPPLEAEAPTHFAAPRARRSRSTTRRRRGRSSRSGCRSCSALTATRRSPAGATAGGGTAVGPRTGRCR